METQTTMQLISRLEEQIERLQLEVRQSHERIHWLEEEIQRYQRLLNGSSSLCDNFKTAQPDNK